MSDGLAQVGEDVELQNQLNFYSGRCAALASQPAESTRTDTSTAARAAPTDPAPAPIRSAFTVQVAAVKTQAAANKVVASLKSAGYESHVASEGGFLKVRVGRYPDRASAQAAAAKIKAKLGGAPYVVPET